MPVPRKAATVVQSIPADPAAAERASEGCRLALRVLHERIWPCASYEDCAAYDQVLARLAADAGVAVPSWDAQRDGVWTAETRASVEQACRALGVLP